MRLLLMLSVTVLIAGCETVASRPCPRVSEFPELTQLRAADELATLPRGAVLPGMMDVMAADRAFNRAICR